MEVKIKQGKEMIDAEIEMVDGVMVVSPKEVKFVPKDGDILSCFFRDEFQGTLVFEEASECGEAIFHFALDADGKFIKGNGCNYFGYVYNLSPATEEEKKRLFDKLAKVGWEWDADKKELIKLKWKPVAGQHLYFVEYDNENLIFIAKAYTYAFEDQIERDKTIAKGWCFKTSKECQEFCNRLNEAINQVKP